MTASHSSTTANNTASTATSTTTTALTTKRKRAGGPRSKTGCATCRQRRVKCGEERPICHACARGKFTCSGYDDTRLAAAAAAAPPNCTAANRSGGGKANGSTSAMALFPVSTYEIPFAVPGGPADRRALHYFLNHAAPDLAGFIAGGFWEAYVPQRCQDEPIVRQALVALSCAHLEYRTAAGGVERKNNSMAVSADTTEAFGRSLRKLRRYMEGENEPSRSLVLICCTIFYNFELLRGDREAAAQHLENGLAIVKAWQAELERGKAEEERDDFEVLITKFSRMDTIATLENIKRVPQIQSTDGPSPRSPRYADICRTSQQAHDTLLRDCIQPFVNFLVHINSQRGTPSFPSAALQTEKEDVEAACRAWRLFTEAYEWEHLTPLPTRNRARMLDAIGFLTTKTHYYGMRLLLSQAFAPDPNASPPASPEDPAPSDRISAKILRLARTVVDLKKKVQAGEPPPTVQLKWSPEPGVVETMLLLANCTQRPETRRQAAEVVAELGRLEGFSGLVGKMTEWLGEGMVGEEVPWIGTSPPRLEEVASSSPEEGEER